VSGVIVPADPLDDHQLARDLAVAAGHRLLELRAADRGGDPDELRRAGDRQSHEFLAAELARLRPDDVVLSEEGKDDPARLTARRTWIVDPLDGTREFGEPGRADWAVHVALWQRGAAGAGDSAAHDTTASDLTAGDLTAGAVALPARDLVLSTAQPAAPRPPADPLRLLVSRSRPPEFVRRLADELGAVLVPLGSAGAKAAAVILGEADAYVHSGGQYEWDSAAPVAVARAAGLHASRIDGSPLRYNQASPALPDILICQADIAPLLLKAISADGSA
jgi:3'(2'), 5'-bisphosphate nucleotidase